MASEWLSNAKSAPAKFNANDDGDDDNNNTNKQARKLVLLSETLSLNAAVIQRHIILQHIRSDNNGRPVGLAIPAFCFSH